MSEENLKTIHYASGDLPKPATNPDFIRMYSHEL